MLVGRLLLGGALQGSAMGLGLGGSVLVDVDPGPQPISIVGPDPADAISGEAYSQFWEIVGGTPPFAFSLVAGALPAWAHASIEGRTLTIEGMPV